MVGIWETGFIGGDDAVGVQWDVLSGRETTTWPSDRDHCAPVTSLPFTLLFAMAQQLGFYWSSFKTFTLIWVYF